MYGAVQRYRSPCTVTHAVRGEFISYPDRKGASGLPRWTVILIRGIVIDAYTVRAKDVAAGLIHESTTTLDGVVTSAGVLRRRGAGGSGDLLVLGVGGLRVASLIWDERIWDWITVGVWDCGSLVRGDAVGMALGRLGERVVRGRDVGEVGSLSSVRGAVFVEGRGRCLVVVGIGADVVVVIPAVDGERDFYGKRDNEISSDGGDDGDVDDVASDAGGSFLKGEGIYSVDLLEYGVKNVKTAIFLEGSFEPTLLVLAESRRSWAGRAAKARLTSQLAAVRLNLQSKGYELSWSMDKLPYDAFGLVCVPEHAGGGALVLAPSLILHVRHGAVASGLSLNSFGDDVAEQYETVLQSDTLLSADCAKCEFMDTHGDGEIAVDNTAIALLSLKGGELYFVTVGTEHGMSIVRAGSTVIAQSIVPINSRLFVLASRLADTLLIEYCKSTSTAALESGMKNPASLEVKRTPEEIEEYEMLYGSAPPMVEGEGRDGGVKADGEDKANETSSKLDLQTNDEGTRGIYDDSDELGWVFAPTSKQTTSWALKVKDTLMSYGPGVDATIGFRNGQSSHRDFVIAGGHAKNGCLAIVNKSVSVNERVRFGLRGCRGAWTLRDEGLRRKRELERRRRNEERDQENAQISIENKQIELLRKKWVEEQLAQYRAKLEREILDESSQPDLSNVNGKEDDNHDINGSEEPPLKKSRPDNSSSDAVNRGLKVNGKAAFSNEEPLPPHGPDYAPHDLEEKVLSMKVIYEEQVNSQHPFREEKQLEPDISDPEMDSLLLMSTAEDTVLLTVDGDLEEVTTTTGFHRNVPTIAAGNLGGSSTYAQVTKKSVVLLAGLERVDEYSISSDLEIKSAEIEDPWVALLLSDSSALFLEAREDKELVATIANEGEKGIDSRALKLYLMYSSSDSNAYAGVYAGPLADEARRAEVSEGQQAGQDVGPTPVNGVLQDLDEEDLLIYGEAALGLKVDEADLSKESPVDVTCERGVFRSESKHVSEEHSVLFVLVKTSGTFELVSADRSIVFQSTRLKNGCSLLIDEGKDSVQDDELAEAESVQSREDMSCVMLKAVSGKLNTLDSDATILVANFSSGVVIYKAFLSTEVSPGLSRIRFIKMIDHDFSARTLLSGNSSQLKLTSFKNVSSQGGIFISGKDPAFVFCERGIPRIHGFHRESEEVDDIRFFASFNNVSCREGFILGSDELVRIGDIDPSHATTYAGEMSVTKIGLRCTVHKVCFHSGSGCYGVLASMPTLIPREERLARIIQSLEKHDKRHYQNTVARIEAARDRKRVPELHEDIHELRLYRADGMELIRSHKLKNGEVGLCMANVQVVVFKRRKPEPGFVVAPHNKAEDGSESAFAASGRMRPKDMLVIGTGYLNGEDASSKGRLLMFEVNRQESYTEQGGVYTAFQMQLIAEKTCPGPVSAVAPLEGYVVCGVGPQVHVYKLVGDEIVHLSFAFAQLYVTDIATVKQYITVADMFKSVEFMFWRERNNSVNFLAKDYEHLEAYATEYLIDEDQLSIVISDSHGNIQLMNYAHVSNPESRGGTRLLSNGGVQIGARINKFLRSKLELFSKPNEDDTKAGGAGTQVTLFPALDGSIGAVVPIDKEVYDLLLRLNDALQYCDDLPRHAGLNPAGFAAFRPQGHSHQMLEHRLLSCHLLRQFWHLDYERAVKVAADAGATVERIAKAISYLYSALDPF